MSKFDMTDLLLSSIKELLQKKFNIDLNKDSKKIAEAVHRMSDFYIQNPTAKTPWNEKWCQVAQIAYYLPLNFFRLSEVVAESNRTGFLNEINHIVDFGSGLGPSFWALNDLNYSQLSAIEISKTACELSDDLWSYSKFGKTQQISRYQSLSQFMQSSQSHYQSKKSNNLFICSYSITELMKSDRNVLENCDNLMIIEPGTHQDGRELLTWREDLLKKNYFAWAPCTHQENCPLLHLNPNDWCHHRIQFERPSWLKDIEKHLPFQNLSLTYSYLLLKRQAPPQLKNKMRVIGDVLNEKGKSRQAICRGSSREFAAWLHRNFDKNSNEIGYIRGTLVDNPEAYEQKSNELRITKNVTK